ncbi:Protein hu-li tai shao [Lamellibrachia satsuma]|nr:Protein hu-li tai shao [Lamellibrachia satsuma]
MLQRMRIKATILGRFSFGLLGLYRLGDSIYLDFKTSEGVEQQDRRMSGEPQVNGPSNGGRYIDSIDPEDPEYVRQLRRPAEVKEDVRLMEERKRVSLIMKTKAFRDELEQIVTETLRSGQHPASLFALQQISELILPSSKLSQTSVLSRAAGPVIPIADIRGVDSMNYCKGEKMLRCKLASCYRLVDLFGWSNSIHCYITARISQELEHFLVVPYGMLYHEVTASSMVKVDMRGETIDSGTTNLSVNKAGFGLHAAIHAARPDIRCILHLQASAAIAVSAMQCGVLSLCPESIVMGDVSYYTEYSGVLDDQEKKDKLTRALGPNNKILVLKNFGIVCCGASVEEAYYNASSCMSACEAQVLTVPVGLDNIVQPSDDTKKRAYELAAQPPPSEEGKRKWRRGEMQFEALMRHLDNAGFRTGHIYREPLYKKDQRRDRINSEVEIPPASSSFSDMFDDDGKFMSPLKQHLKKQQKCEWLNTPNAYKREEYDEINTATPKKYTRWVSEGAGGQPIKLEDPNMFAPQGANPKELTEKFKEIRKEYYEDKLSSGPQSKILDGVGWDEAQQAKDGQSSGTADTVVVVGAASKGIIQRDHQHDAVVYKTYYASNPFDSMTEADVEKYKAEVERHSRGEMPQEGDMIVPGPDGRLISTQERLDQVRQNQSGDADANVRPGVTETCIDDVLASPTTSSTPAPRQATTDQPFVRSHSARRAPDKSPKLVQELEQNFSRSKSERKPKGKSKKSAAINGDEPVGSPAKSTSSGDGTHDDSSPTKEAAPGIGSPTKEKKKKKFRMPSFSKKKDKKSDK